MLRCGRSRRRVSGGRLRLLFDGGCNLAPIQRRGTLDQATVLMTAPAWTPLFSRVAAIVTDTGSVAAHASIVAREYGLPAVVGTADSTARLRDGDLIEVDGSAGVVRRLWPDSPETRRKATEDEVR